jgi:hypothetical protein
MFKKEQFYLGSIRYAQIIIFSKKTLILGGRCKTKQD